MTPATSNYHWLPCCGTTLGRGVALATPRQVVTTLQPVLRGGSFTDDEYSLRSSYRNPNDPTDRYYSLGFRCSQ